MRCDCPDCGIYMAHAEDIKMGCICPNCEYRCAACLGTKTVWSKETILAMKEQQNDTEFLGIFENNIEN